MRVTTEHAQHDAVTEEISHLKIVGHCRKRAAQEDSHTLPILIRFYLNVLLFL